MKTLLGVALFGKPFELKKGRGKKAKHEPCFTLPRIFGETKNLYGKLKERIMGEAGK